jgi:hypothetical protein
MKKIQWMACSALFAGEASAATIEESFDWGAGVAGRQTVTNGQNIGGSAVQTGGVSWVRSTGTGVFSGSEGAGNGTLTMTGGNAIGDCNILLPESSGSREICRSRFFLTRSPEEFVASGDSLLGELVKSM